MDISIEQKRIADMNWDDPFFDSLKEDYPASPTCIGMMEWFRRKAAQGESALVLEDSHGLGAFARMKFGEVEALELADGTTFPPMERVKVSVLKIDERYRKLRIGERIMGEILRRWCDNGAEEIYNTIFPKHADMIALVEKFGFVAVGNNLNGERMFKKSRRRIDFTDPCKAFPFYSNRFQNFGCLAVEASYHDALFIPGKEGITFHKNEKSCGANGIKKVLLYAVNPDVCVGEPVLIYRDGTEANSGITAYGLVSRAEQIRKGGKPLMPYEAYRKILSNKSAYEEQELQEKYDSMDDLFVIELVHYGTLDGKNIVSRNWMEQNDCWRGENSRSCHYTRKQFEAILREGHVNVKHIFVD